MAAPIIDSVTVDPDPVPSGQSAIVKIEAHDPDAQMVTVHVAVSDAGGTRSPEKFHAFAVSDPLTYEATVDSGHLTQDATDPSVFIWNPDQPGHEH